MKILASTPSLDINGTLYLFYRVFHRFGQAEFAYGGSILGLSQFTQLPQLPQKMTHNLKKGQNQLENNHLASLI